MTQTSAFRVLETHDGNVQGTVEPHKKVVFADVTTKSSGSGAENEMSDLALTETLAKLTLEEEEKMTQDWKAEQKELDKMFETQAKTKIAALPEIAIPTLHNVELHQYQKDGIRWMYHQETKQGEDAIKPLFKKVDHSRWGIKYRCSITGKYSAELPKPVRGGILADDMGLGKTIQTLGLILANPASSPSEPRTTLIVSPVSVMSNWEAQISKYANSEKKVLKIATFHGPQRHRLLTKIEHNQFDVVLVSYETLTSEMKTAFGTSIDIENSENGSINDDDVSMGGEPTILDTHFHRIVLDEAHGIRNSKKSFRAVCKVRATHKWALTGSPFVNNPGDIQSLLSFLELKPLSSATVFNTYVSSPIQKLQMIGLTRLRTVLAHVALRRSKFQVGSCIDLADKEVEIKAVSFPGGIHQTIHDHLYKSTREKASQYLLDGQGSTSDLFTSVLRVRQACCDGNLVPKELQLEATSGNSTAVIGRSPKIQAMLDLIAEMAPDEKAVIFSEWTSYLDIIATELQKEGHTFARFVGNMKPAERSEAIKRFSDDDAPRFLLCSIGSAGVGINLTRANVAFLMSPFWNSAQENQAMDRIHRLGQEQDVRVYRLVMAGSIEERMIKYQEAKAALGKGSMEKLKKQDLKKAKVAALKDLFEIEEKEEKLLGWDIFDVDDFIVDDDEDFEL